MKLAICIVHSHDRSVVTEELVQAGFKFTLIGSTGGFLREGNSTFLIGVEDDEVEVLQELMAARCKAREQLVNVMPIDSAPSGALLTSAVKVPVGGAVMFVLNVEQFARF